MKELSVEEKARRYDEAIEKLRSLHDDYDAVSTLIDIKEELEHIFPELKESEDEKIMKEILQSIKDNMIVIHKDKCIVWLEKQLKVKEAMRDVEQKAKAFTKAHAGETSEEILAQMRGYEWSEEDERIKMAVKEAIEYYWSDDKQAMNDTLAWLEKQGEHKPVWSDEDENHVKSILSTIECCKTQFPNAQAVVEAYNADIEWLKDLKDRYTWKPSEEQMDALDEVYKTHGANSACRRIIFNLMNDLKKL